MVRREAVNRNSLTNTFICRRIIEYYCFNVENKEYCITYLRGKHSVYCFIIPIHIQITPTHKHIVFLLCQIMYRTLDQVNVDVTDGQYENSIVIILINTHKSICVQLVRHVRYQSYLKTITCEMKTILIFF